MATQQSNSKALARVNPRDSVISAFNDAYNPKNRTFLYGGKTVEIPTNSKNEDVLDLCLSLKGIKIPLIPSLEPIKQQLQSTPNPTSPNPE